MEDLHGESQKCLPLRLPTEGEGGLEYLSPWKTFFCLVWMPRPLQAGQCSAPTLWLSDPWLGARVSGHGGDNETPQNQTNFQSPISPRFRNRPFFPSPRAGIKMTNQTFYLFVISRFLDQRRAVGAPRDGGGERRRGESIPHICHGRYGRRPCKFFWPV